MARLALLLGSFLLTFALLSVVWMVSLGRPSADTPESTPSHSPYYTLAATGAPATQSPEPTSAPSATAEPTPEKTPGPTASPARTAVGPSSSPAPLRTSLPSFALPSAAGAETQVFTIPGSAFVESTVPDGGSIAPYGDGAVLQTTQAGADALWVIYRLDPSQFPAGAQPIKVDTLVCGQGTGQFWEIYGPVGSTPSEFEVSQPDADGCWHFTDAPADDLSVITSTMLESSLFVEKVEYTVTFVR